MNGIAIQVADKIRFITPEDHSSSNNNSSSSNSSKVHNNNSKVHVSNVDGFFLNRSLPSEMCRDFKEFSLARKLFTFVRKIQFINVRESLVRVESRWFERESPI